MNHHALLKLSAINSVASYLLPEVFRNLSHELDKIQICFRHCHFSEAYDYVADGIVDLALISNTRYYPNLETIPLFQEPMVLLTNNSVAYPNIVSPESLNPCNEIFLPWNPKYQSWHDHWFSAAALYRAFTDQMNLLEDFLSWKNTWAIAPFSVADPISKLSYVSTHTIDHAPSDRMIYYVKKVNREIRFEKVLFQVLKNKLKKYPKIHVVF